MESKSKNDSASRKGRSKAEADSGEKMRQVSNQKIKNSLNELEKSKDKYNKLIEETNELESMMQKCDKVLKNNKI